MKIDPIQTTRLVLRNYTKADMDFVISIWNDPDMGKYLPDPSIENVDKQYMKAYKTMEEYEECCYLISVFVETGELIGTCSFVPGEDGSTYDLGYCVHKKFQENGYATEMAQGMIDYAGAHGAREITATVHKENVASIALMRKLGFTIVGETQTRKIGTGIIMGEYLYRLEL